MGLNVSVQLPASAGCSQCTMLAGAGLRNQALRRGFRQRLSQNPLSTTTLTGYLNCHCCLAAKHRMVHQRDAGKVQTTYDSPMSPFGTQNPAGVACICTRKRCHPRLQSASGSSNVAKKTTWQQQEIRLAIACCNIHQCDATSLKNTQCLELPRSELVLGAPQRSKHLPVWCIR